MAGTGKPANNADVTDYAAAAATAQSKADAAQQAAENYTNIREQAMIDGVITDAEQGAIDAAATDASMAPCSASVMTPSIMACSRMFV